jgi:hypothetical protein
MVKKHTTVSIKGQKNVIYIIQLPRCPSCLKLRIIKKLIYELTRGAA